MPLGDHTDPQPSPPAFPGATGRAGPSPPACSGSWVSAAYVAQLKRCNHETFIFLFPTLHPSETAPAEYNKDALWHILPILRVIHSAHSRCPGTRELPCSEITGCARRRHRWLLMSLLCSSGAMRCCRWGEPGRAGVMLGFL